MTTKEIKRRTQQELLVGYPIGCRLPDWFFRIRETSNNAWLVEGCDRWGRKVSRAGGNPDVILDACIRDAKAISARTGD